MGLLNRDPDLGTIPNLGTIKIGPAAKIDSPPTMIQSHLAITGFQDFRISGYKDAKYPLQLIEPRG